MAADQGIRTPKNGSCETAQMGALSGNRFPGTEMPQGTSSGSPRPGGPLGSPRGHREVIRGPETLTLFREHFPLRFEVMYSDMIFLVHHLFS